MLLASASLLSGSKEAGELEVVAVSLAVDANARCGLAGLWLAGCVVHSRQPGWLGDAPDGLRWEEVKMQGQRCLVGYRV